MSFQFPSHFNFDLQFEQMKRFRSSTSFTVKLTSCIPLRSPVGVRQFIVAALSVRLKPQIPIAVLFSLALFSPVFSQAGETGLSFLKLGVGARSVAMGEAHAAMASDASATYYNPAGLSEATKANIMIMHKEWFQDVRTEFLGVCLPFAGYAIGLGVNTTNVDNVQLRRRPGPPEGTFSSHDFAAGVSFAGKVTSTLSAGVSLKFLYEKIFVDEASGVAADIGVLYQTPIEGLKLALAGSNFGSMGNLRNDKIKLPSLLRVGSSFVRELDIVYSTLTVGADLVKVFREDKAHLHTGAEVSYQEKIAFRFGYLFGYESRGLTVGLGLRRDFLRLDYGFSPQSQDLSNGHTVSVGVEF